jgi:hypothetical protein
MTVISNTSGGWTGDIGSATVSDICDINPNVTNNAPSVFLLANSPITVEWTATDQSGNANWDYQVITVLPKPITVDIKPGSCPNPLNVKSKGVLPVAILGNESFYVTEVDPETLRLVNESAPFDVPNETQIAPRWSYNDVNKDGWVDLISHFKAQDVMAICPTLVPDGDDLVLKLKGDLLSVFGSVPIEGADTVVVLNK